MDQYAFGHIPFPGTAPPPPASVASRDSQGDRNMRDAGLDNPDIGVTQLPADTSTAPGDPTPPSTIPTSAHGLDLTPGPTRGVSFDARLEKPPKYGGKRDRDACRVWLNRMRMHLLSEQILGGVTYSEGQ